VIIKACVEICGVFGGSVEVVGESSLTAAVDGIKVIMTTRINTNIDML
jgi:hypothetical protein